MGIDPEWLYKNQILNRMPTQSRRSVGRYHRERGGTTILNWTYKKDLIPEVVGQCIVGTERKQNWRISVDFRDQNNACPKDRYPLPRIDLLVD